MDAWIDEELAANTLPDQRLKKRCRTLLAQLWSRIGNTIPASCQDLAATKAAYRFFSNPKVTQAMILAGHFAATASRFKRERGMRLVLHDTTEVTFHRKDAGQVGFTGRATLKAGDGKKKSHAICGILLHASLVVTGKGLPLGLAAAKFWTRKKFKGSTALYRKVNAGRVPIEEKESYRWVEGLEESTQRMGQPSHCVHIGDREADIYEVFSKANELGTHVLVRSRVDRTAGPRAKTTMLRLMKRSPVRGEHTLTLRDGHGRPYKARLRLRFQTMTLHAPRDKRKRYGPLKVSVIHAREVGRPAGRDPVRWRLITDLEVTTLKQAVEKLAWYAMRWQIETYFNVLKSGCGIEDRRLQTDQRLANLLALYCVVGWRTYWLTMLARIRPDEPAETGFTELEQRVLDAASPTRDRRKSPTIHRYVQQLARLGGYLARKSDGPPGNKTVWRGMVRLTDITLGVRLAGKDVGN